MVCLGNAVEICANCGKIRRDLKKAFRCAECGCEVCIVVPYKIFKDMVDSGAARE